MISMKGLSKAEVLSALYNRAKKPSFDIVLKKSVLFDLLRVFPDLPFPFDKKIFFSSKNMTVQDAQNYLDAVQHRDEPLNLHFVCTRHLGVDLSGDAFDPEHYDFANGQGAAQEAIEKLRLDLNKPEQGLYETMQAGWFGQYSQELAQEEDKRNTVVEDEHSDTLGEDEEQEDTFGDTLPKGWFAQYSKELEEERESKESKESSKVVDSPSEEEQRDFGSSLKRGWFNQYSQEEGTQNKPKEQAPAQVKEASQETEEKEESFGSGMRRGWFTAYSESTPELPNAASESDSDDEGVFILVQKLDKLKLNKKH